jgi:hypothetical protein
MKQRGAQLLWLLGAAPALLAQVPPAMPYGRPPETTPGAPLSAAMRRLYDGHGGRWSEAGELYSRFRYTPLAGFDYHGHDGTISRRGPSKVIRAGGQYYVWYSGRHTAAPPRGAKGSTETIPSTDNDLFDIWYATSADGLTWRERGIAVRRPGKPPPGWRSLASPDILIWKGRFYLYFQAYSDVPTGRADYSPFAVAVAETPDGPWQVGGKLVLERGLRGAWDESVIHDPCLLVFQGKIWLYYKGETGRSENFRAQGVATAIDPLGPFSKHQLNPVINSGHETCLFPFRNGIAALVTRHGPEHNTIQFAPDGVNFRMAAISSMMPVAAGPYVPDAFAGNGDGGGITWGLAHISRLGIPDKGHAMLVRFDCSLSRDGYDPELKQTDVPYPPEAYFLSGAGSRIERKP